MFRLSDSEAKKAGLKVAKSSKYGVRQDSLGKLGRTIDGIKFDSQREANRYCELKILERNGGISAFRIQVKFPLLVHDKLIGYYVADFVMAKDGKTIVEDAKGFATPLYKWKRKHFTAQYGIEIREV